MINLIIYHYWKIFCLKLDKSICYIGHLEISISVLLVSYDFSFQRWHICLTSIDTKFWKEQINTLFVNLSHWKLHIYVHWNDIFFILAYWFIFGCVNANKSFQTLKKSHSLISRNIFKAAVWKTRAYRFHSGQYFSGSQFDKMVKRVKKDKVDNKNDQEYSNHVINDQTRSQIIKCDHISSDRSKHEQTGSNMIRHDQIWLYWIKHEQTGSNIINLNKTGQDRIKHDQNRSNRIKHYQTGSNLIRQD